MAIVEQRIIKSIQVLPNQSSIQVQWADQVVKDGAAISERFHRKAYGPDQQAEFLAEVDGAENYVGLISWTAPEDQPIRYTVSSRQIRLALTQVGLRTQVETEVALGGQDLKDWWEYTTEFKQDHPMILEMATKLGQTEQQVADLFALAITL